MRYINLHFTYLLTKYDLHIPTLVTFLKASEVTFNLLLIFYSGYYNIGVVEVGGWKVLLPDVLTDA